MTLHPEIFALRRTWNSGRVPQWKRMSAFTCVAVSTDFACDPCRDSTVSTNHAMPACTSIFVWHASPGKIARSAIALGERSDLYLPCQHYSQERHHISHGMTCAFSGISILPVPSFNLIYAVLHDQQQDMTAKTRCRTAECLVHCRILALCKD